ncbi:MAG TPA: ABC transporter ATP-binding protein [Desulfomonilaceae bacterium]|nr:ABC transporter ATP-binding protein [Desulfomonilaceae bacterium]
MLEIRDLHVSYGGIKALKGVSLRIEKRMIVTLLGANGAGKSTAIRAVSGIVPILSGDVLFQGKSIKNLPAHQIQRLGLVHVPEGRRIFANLTVRENLVIGAYNNKDKADIAATMKRIVSTFPVLASRQDQLGGTLSGGEQQMLAIGRALMSRPKLLMMDEPSLGLAPMVVAEVFRVIQDIRNEGVTIFLIEQNANAALKITDHAILLETGAVVLEGSGAQLLEDTRVKQAYLGEKAKLPTTP